MKTILLHITKTGPRYHPDHALPWAATNLPADAFTLRESEPIYWRVRLHAYDQATEELEVEVLDYRADYQPDFATQQPKRPVARLRFRPLQAAAFKAQLSYYDAGRLANVLLAERVAETDQPGAIDWSAPPETASTPTEPPLPVTPPTQVRLEFSAPMSDLAFELGIIKGARYVEEWGIAIDFYVENDFILPEFDYVKGYLAKALQRWEVPITLTTTLRAAMEDAVPARSPVLESIDENLLEIVRARMNQRFLEKPRFDAPVDKSLFTSDELYDHYAIGEEPWGGALRTPEEQLLADILQHRKVRNAKQLRFLAAHVHHARERLRFTLYPQFGFLFTARGDRRRHLIWELLDSNATYLWTYDPAETPPAVARRALEQALQFIKVNGRRAYRENPTLSDHLVFHAITHRHANSKLIDGFPRWRHALVEGLI